MPSMEQVAGEGASGANLATKALIALMDLGRFDVAEKIRDEAIAEAGSNLTNLPPGFDNAASAEAGRNYVRMLYEGAEAVFKHREERGI